MISIIVGGGLFMVWYTYRMEGLFSYLIDKDVAAVQMVGRLEGALANQKGSLDCYCADGDKYWLRQIDKYGRDFSGWLNEIKHSARAEADRRMIVRIELGYKRYIDLVDEVVSLYKADNRKAGGDLLQEVSVHIFSILDLFQEYKDIQYQRISATREESRVQAERLRLIALTGASIAVLMGGLLVVIVTTQILGPVRKLALETDRSGRGENPEDEVVALSQQVRGLIQDMEKFVLVGKLAAGVAHSIRNPLTSVKMRLFSLERSLELAPSQREDFEVVSEEILVIDNILQNFLEFSRPPKLKMQKVSPSDVVDNALQLLKDRFESYNITVAMNREGRLPTIMVDPEQLKEVVVNLLVNACEAMGPGGRIGISERESTVDKAGRVAVIELNDNGPGIPATIQEKVFQPFFSNKEEGTGLGLTIAARIINEHQGTLHLRSKEGEGSTFTIILPARRGSDEQNSHS
ncbi:MAG: histidine kinase [Deltaproteobacteria bacterium]|nr:histidine kinase [Deltaproteobacteria bacterium]